MIESVRNMMLYHIQGEMEPQVRINKVRSFLDFLSKSVPDKYNTYASFLGVYLNYANESLSMRDDASLLHDELEEVNFPVYFSQFMEQATHFGLQYLVESSFQTMMAKNLSVEVVNSLRQIAGNSVEYQQYIDFLHNRTFRQTLLCHNNIQLYDVIMPEQINNLYIASSARPESPKINVHSYSTERFSTSKEENFSASHPITKIAMIYLNEIWPNPVKFDILLEKANTRLVETMPEHTSSHYNANNSEALAEDLLNAYKRSSNLVELHTYIPKFTLEISEQPTVSPVARFQVKNDTIVTNLRHERIDLKGTSHFHLLPYLDGSRNRAALLEIVKQLVVDDTINLQQETDLGEELDSILSQLANATLLVD